MERRSKPSTFIPIEELQAKFKSKHDLYVVISVDMGYFLPSIDKCPIAFLRSVMSGDKKAIKNNKTVKVCVLKYKELSTRRIWEYVREIPDLCIYFPDYTKKQCPDKDYLFSLLGALRGEQLNSFIQDARKKRSIHEAPDTNEYAEVNDEILKELHEVFTQKTYIATRGKACFMLKKSAKLTQARRNPAQHYADLKMLDEKDDRDKNGGTEFTQARTRGYTSIEMDPADEEEKE